MDYDMPEDLNAAMLISPRTHPTTVTSLEDPVNPQPIQDVIQPDGTIDPPRRQRGKRKHTGHYRKAGARAPNENTF